LRTAPGGRGSCPPPSDGLGGQPRRPADVRGIIGRVRTRPWTSGRVTTLYINPSTPPLHHFLHSSIRIRTSDCVATAALHGSWWWEVGSNCWVQTLLVFFHNLRRRRMELNTFFTKDECSSDSHSTGSGRSRGRVGGRSQGSTLSGGSNPGGASSGGRSTIGGRSTTSGRGQGGMLPPIEGSSGHPKKAWSSFRSW
jgi:hypothetical protein